MQVHECTLLVPLRGCYFHDLSMQLNVHSTFFFCTVAGLSECDEIAVFLESWRSAVGKKGNPGRSWCLGKDQPVVRCAKTPAAVRAYTENSRRRCSYAHSTKSAKLKGLRWWRHVLPGKLVWVTDLWVWQLMRWQNTAKSLIKLWRSIVQLWSGNYLIFGCSIVNALVDYRVLFNRWTRTHSPRGPSVLLLLI